MTRIEAIKYSIKLPKNNRVSIYIAIAIGKIMNLQSVRGIIKKYPELKLCKHVKGHYAILDVTSKDGIRRGLIIKNYRLAVCVSFWLTPKICLPSSDIIVFNNYYIDTDDREISLNKSLSTESSIIEKIKNAIDYNIPQLREINNLALLEDYLFANQRKWLISDLAKIQFGILHYYNNRDFKAIEMIKSVYPLINPLHPIRKEISDFVTLIEKGDTEEINNYFDHLETLTEARFNELNT